MPFFYLLYPIRGMRSSFNSPRSDYVYNITNRVGEKAPYFEVFLGCFCSLHLREHMLRVDAVFYWRFGGLLVLWFFSKALFGVAACREEARMLGLKACTNPSFSFTGRSEQSWILCFSSKHNVHESAQHIDAYLFDCCVDRSVDYDFATNIADHKAVNFAMATESARSRLILFCMT